MTSWRWWLFYGVAHETPRMIYEPPLLRIARVMRATIDAYTTMARTIGEQLTPVFRQLAATFSDLGNALAGQPTKLSHPRRSID